MADDDRALVPVKTVPAVPALRFAANLESADPHTVVHIDRHGQTRSIFRYRAITVMSWSVTTAALGWVALTWGRLFGVPGVLAAGAFGALVAWRIRRASAVSRAFRLLTVDRIDEADELLRGALDKGGLTPIVRSFAYQYSARIATLRGDHQLALEYFRKALVTLDGRRRGRAATRLVEYGEIATLVNLGRAGEARVLFASRHAEVPRGDYLRIMHWSTDMYIGVAEGVSTVSDDVLHERARESLLITSSSGLLGLCAWAYARRGDTDQAWHLLREAYDRLTGTRLQRGMPLLWTWMEENRTEAGA